MKHEIQEFLALELTKAKINSSTEFKASSVDAKTWVNVFNQSLVEIENETKSDGKTSVRRSGLI